MTSKDRQAALRARRKDQGLVRVEVWVPKERREWVKEEIKAMMVVWSDTPWTQTKETEK